jgi:hypothetical protein
MISSRSSISKINPMKKKKKINEINFMSGFVYVSFYFSSRKNDKNGLELHLCTKQIFLLFIFTETILYLYEKIIMLEWNSSLNAYIRLLIVFGEEFQFIFSSSQK